VESGARAGITSFSGTLLLSGSTLDCNPIQLDAETLPGPNSPAPSFEDQGGNRCGCGEQTEECRVLSSNLAPPDAL